MVTLKLIYPGALLNTVEREISDEQATQILAWLDTPRIIELHDATPEQIAKSQRWPTGEPLIDRAMDGDR